MIKESMSSNQDLRARESILTLLVVLAKAPKSSTPTKREPKTKTSKKPVIYTKTEESSKQIKQ